MMIVPCVLCERQIDTRNEEVIVNVSWIFNDILKKNNVQLNKNIPRLVKICKKCWTTTLKDKPQGNDYYWIFNKTI